MDRIGDLVLSLPADEVVSDDYECVWVVPQNLGFLPRVANPKRNFIELGVEFKNILKLYNFLVELKPEYAVVFHAPWWVSLAVFMAGVPNRCGVLSQWYSFLFFNKGVRQRRNRAEFHEIDYNLQLVKSLFQNTKPVTDFYLKIATTNHLTTLNKWGLTPQTYYVIHPGMGGSALNWTADRYSDLIKNLIQKNKVVVTGTDQDKQWLDPIRKNLAGVSNILWSDGKLNSYEILDILKGARVTVAPSTGIVHLSASMETPTIGLYSPVRVEAPIRWGPRGKFVRVLVPPYNEVARQKSHPDIMELITTQEVLNSIEELEKAAY